MSKPPEKPWLFFKRIARYLVHEQALVIECGSEESADGGTVVYSDRDWESCRTTRRYMRGGVLCAGGHVVKTWSATRGHLALS